MNQSLLHLDLRNNKVSPKGGQIIANALKFNKTLLSIGKKKKTMFEYNGNIKKNDGY